MRTADRLDNRKLRECLNKNSILGRSVKPAIVLAPKVVAEMLAGCPSGCIPPLIISRELPLIPTVLDSSALQETEILVGSGVPGERIRMSPHAFIRCKGVHSGNIAKQTEIIWRNSSIHAQHQSNDLPIFRGSTFKAFGYPPNSEVLLQLERAERPLPLCEFVTLEVTLNHVDFIAKIGSKRCVSKNLAFISVIPYAAGPPVSNMWRAINGTASSVVNLQLIVGATIQRIYGREACQRLIRSIKVGHVVRVVGSTQRNPTQENTIDIACNNLQLLSPTEISQLTQFQSKKIVEDVSLAIEKWQMDRSRRPLIPEKQNITLIAIKNISLQSESKATKDAKSVLPFFSINESDVNIHYVDDLNSLLSMERILSQLEITTTDGLVSLLAIDCEWRPEGRFYIEPLDVGSYSNKKSKPHAPVAVLQLSTRTDVFICDMLFICRNPSTDIGEATEKESVFDRLLSNVFSSHHVLKVGLGVNQDLKRLAWSYPWLKSLQIVEPVLDIEALSRLAFPDLSKRDVEGISKLSSLLLGLAVNKDQQVSDWGTRPLSRSQILYAAIDSLVLVRLFDTLCIKNFGQKSINSILSNISKRIIINCPPRWSPGTLRDTLLNTVSILK